MMVRVESLTCIISFNFHKTYKVGIIKIFCLHMSKERQKMFMVEIMNGKKGENK